MMCEEERREELQKAAKRIRKGLKGVWVGSEKRSRRKSVMADVEC
jgi:hypothetical protein